MGQNEYHLKEGIMKVYKEITCSIESTNEPCDRCKYKYHPMYSSPCAECGVDFPNKFEPMDKVSVT